MFWTPGDLRHIGPCKGILRQAVPDRDIELIARRGTTDGAAPKIGMNSRQSLVYHLLRDVSSMMTLFEEAALRAIFSITDPSWRAPHPMTNANWQTLADACATDIVVLAESWVTIAGRP